MKKRTQTEVRFIDYVIGVIQQYGTLNGGKQAHFWSGDMGVVADGLWLLYEYKVTKDYTKLRLTEIKKYYKNPFLQNIK